jgi:hypothetical protein
MAGEDFAEGEGCAEFCCPSFSGRSDATPNATAEINSNVVVMSIRMGKR